MCVWSQWQMSERERQRGADGEMFLPWTVTEAALSLSVSRSIWAASLFFFFLMSAVLFFSSPWVPSTKSSTVLALSLLLYVGGRLGHCSAVSPHCPAVAL